MKTSKLVLYGIFFFIGFILLCFIDHSSFYQYQYSGPETFYDGRYDISFNQLHYKPRLTSGISGETIPISSENDYILTSKNFQQVPLKRGNRDIAEASPPPFQLENQSDRYHGFDPYGLYVGKYTSLDKIHDSTKTINGPISENPLDPNWGGDKVSQNAIDAGKYKGNEVYKITYPKAGITNNVPRY